MKKRLYTSLLLALTLTACGGGTSTSSIAPEPRFIVNTEILDTELAAVGTLRPAVSTSPYASVLVNCVEARNGGGLPMCSLGTLPILGAKGAIPTKTEILQRTLVNDDAVATRFAEMLDHMPEDIYKLFGAVTAIVIAKDLDSAFYASLTGTIYLDAKYLQDQTNAKLRFQKLSSFEKGEAAKLAFREVFGLHDPHADSTSNRANQVEFASVLFHELAHANDYMPPSQQSKTNPLLTMPEQIDQFESEGVYDNDMHLAYPLTSTVMSQLAEIIYADRTPTTAEQNMSAQVVSMEFAADGGNDSYNHYKYREDAAMLFEELMLKKHFNVDRAFGFTNAPKDSNDCSQYIVYWGSINRVNHPNVKHRAKKVAEKFLGISDASAYFQGFNNTRSMTPGVNFCQNLDQLTGA